MSKHLVEIDDDLLGAARAELGTPTLKATIEAALRLSTRSREREVSAALDVLAGACLEDRASAWR
jgi:Arc/MetJ family transcription regulator